MILDGGGGKWGAVVIVVSIVGGRCWWWVWRERSPLVLAGLRFSEVVLEKFSVGGGTFQDVCH